MTVPVWIPRRYDSRYSLLGAMASELAEAISAKGFDAREDTPDGSIAGIYIFFNMPPSIEAIPPAARRPGSRVALIQILVDHPLALDAGIMDQTSRLPNFRLALPSIDGLHMLRLRWPTLRHAHMPHGIPRSALIAPELCTPDALSQRPHDVVVAGSIHTEQGVRELKWALPAQAHPWIDEIVQLMLKFPAMPYEQALDCVCGSRSVITGNWPMAAAMWRAVAADFNRQHRVQLVQSLQGIDVAVYGADAWDEFCTGTIKYAGNVEYADVPKALTTGRVCLAWGPTQFPHTFSERLLLSMASGCASVCEDRYLVRQHFGTEHCTSFDPQQPTSARDAIESLLSDPIAQHAMSMAGRTIVESDHLWENRVDKLASLASEAISRPLAPANATQSVTAGA
ncbi:MAG: glycosyltransferase family 1 protein [Phycisphaerales bacterium]|nr:glycosyltransferase family 1 protein [Phycisphaerales bacterium]